MKTTEMVLVKVTRPDGSRVTLRIDRRLAYVLARATDTDSHIAMPLDVSPSTIEHLRRRMRRIWERDAGMAWPPAPGSWEVSD